MIRPFTFSLLSTSGREFGSVLDQGLRVHRHSDRLPVIDPMLASHPCSVFLASPR
jgi:hypothetical protein